MAKQNPSTIVNLGLLAAAAAGGVFVYRRFKDKADEGTEGVIYDRGSFNCDLDAMIEAGASARVIDSIIAQWNDTGTGRDPCTVPTDAQAGMQLATPGGAPSSDPYAPAIDRCEPFLANGKLSFSQVFSFEAPTSIKGLTELVNTVASGTIPFRGTVIFALGTKEPDMTYTTCNLIRQKIDAGSSAASRIKLFRKTYSSAEAQAAASQANDLVGLIQAMENAISAIPGSKTSAAIAKLRKIARGLAKLRDGLEVAVVGTIASVSLGPRWDDYQFILGLPLELVPEPSRPVSDDDLNFTVVDLSTPAGRAFGYTLVGAKAIASVS
jgi:hypothetical protein